MPRPRKAKAGEKLLVQARLPPTAWEKLETYRYQLSLQKGFPVSTAEALVALIEALPKPAKS